MEKVSWLDKIETMEQEYDEKTAHYYSKYRPPLHEIILSKCIKSGEKFDLGLDVGCGTGNSSIALSQYCTKVIGIDPSAAMLAKASNHPRLEYKQMPTTRLSFDENSFDIITFAGSLYYAKSQEVLDETIRVSKKGGLIIIYDFEIELDHIMQILVDNSKPKVQENYNHKEDFSGLNLNGIVKKTSSCESFSTPISIKNISQLLLSSKVNYKVLISKFGVNQVEQKIQYSLSKKNSQADKLQINSKIYHTIYQLK